MEPVEPVQMNIYQSNTYKKDLSWVHFHDESRAQERQQVKEQQPYIYIFVVYLRVPSSSKEHQLKHDNSIPCKDVWWIYRDTEHSQKETSWNKFVSNFLGGNFSNRDNVRAPIQFRKERQPKHLKRDGFSSRADPSIFTSIAPVLLDPQNKTS